MRKLLLFTTIIISFIITSCTPDITLDELLLELETQNKAMGTISVFNDGNEVYNKSFGFAILEKNKKADNNTRYWIGSISKTYTATIILQLVDENKINLETTLNQFFPTIKNADNISIAQLLKHRSGIYNITRSPNFESWVAKPRSKDEIITKLNNFESEFTPGEKTGYSNTNFILLSYISETIEKKSFNEILNERIFKKLNLKRTSFADTLNLNNNEAMDYFPENGNWSPITYQTNLTGTMGAGGIISTPKEINIFYQNLFSGKLLSEKSLKKMTIAIDEMGMGIGVSDYNGLTAFGHDGAIDGFRSIVAYIPNKKLSIALTFNASKITMGKTLKRFFKAYQKTFEKK